jgi:lysophospholipase L1-like esterase
MGTRRRRTLFANLALAALSFAVALALAESLLWLFFWDRLEENNHHQLFVEFDPMLGWRKKSSFSGWHVTPEYAVREELNSKGLRGPEIPYERTPGATRILMLGDSFAEGYSVALEDTVSEVLARELDARRGGVHEVVNAGTGGYSTDQELLFFGLEGAKYRPDAVVLLFFLNDVTPNVEPVHSRYGYLVDKPLFELDGDRLRVGNLPLEARPRQVLDTERDPGFWQRNSLVLRLLARWRNVPSLYGLAFRLGLVEGDPLRLGPEFDPSDILGWPMTQRLLEALDVEVSRAGGQLVVFYVPTRSLGGGDEVLAGMLRAFAAPREIPFVDPIARFRDETDALTARTGRGLYFPLDGHWNENGHRLAAEILANVLADGVLPQPAATAGSHSSR